MKRLIGLLVAIVLSHAAEAQVLVEGVVMDRQAGEPLAGAAIVISGTQEGVITDIDGHFSMELQEGGTVLDVIYMGYESIGFVLDVSSGNISVKEGADGSITVLQGKIIIGLQMEADILENAVVTGRKNLETLQALRNERISSGHAIENMGAKEMSLKGISDAQESVVKFSGISVADAGQLIVRGLGDRYSTTTLNGLPIASPNPDNKLIPLDIFPASTIQNITVSKVYEAGSFADYSGAHLDISTKEGRSEDFFSVSFSTGGYFNTLSRSFRNMDTPSLFFTPRLDSGAENVPYPEFASYSRNNEIFRTSFSTINTSAMPDLNGNAGWGKTVALGGNELAILATASLKSGNETVSGAFYKTYEASSSGALRSSYDYDSYTSKLNLAALLNMQYSFRQSDNVGFTAFFARNARDSHLDRSGYDYLESYNLIGRNQVTHFYKLQNYQLSGHHEFGTSWFLDWGASYGLTSSEEPDRRQVMFRKYDDGSLRFFDLNQQETQRYYGSLGENEAVADIRSTYNFDDSGNRIRFGLTGRFKNRAFETTRFYYNLKSLDGNIGDPDNLDSSISFDNISAGLVSIDRKKHKRDKYDAYSMVAASFVETDLKFWGKWSFNLGLRCELSRQNVDYNDDVADLTRKLDAVDLFPAVNLRYDLDRCNVFRFSVSRTITRPSFVEMAPFLYQESFGGAQIRGNEYLENGYNYNADLKYEFFSDSSDDMFAVTAYFKYLDNPIERTQRLAGGATEHSFQNADNGIAAGMEMELRKRVVKDLYLSANASFMYTNVKLPEGGVYTNLERSLQGASPYLANIDLSYTPAFSNGSGLAIALLYNLQGPRIQSVGIMGLGDVTQCAFHSLDFNCSYTFAARWSVRMSFFNLLDQAVRFVQDIPNADRTVEVEKWRLGRGMEIGISYGL